ncbi:MAG: hypothetical protein QXT25_03530 [Candidatus Anstonellaceae archaeon]
MQSQKQNLTNQIPQQAKFFRRLLEDRQLGESGRMMEGVPKHQIPYEKMVEIIKRNPLLGC